MMQQIQVEFSQPILSSYVKSQTIVSQDDHFSESDSSQIGAQLHQVNYQTKSVSIYDEGKVNNSNKRRSLNVSQRYSHQEDKKSYKTCGNHQQTASQNITGQYQCSNCLIQPQKQCSVCQGHGVIHSKMPLVKFFQFFVQYKLGRTTFDDFQKGLKKKVSQKNKIIEQTKSDSQLLSQSLPWHSSKTITKHYKKMDQESLSTKISEYENIHYGYYCNLCSNENPIKGKKLHCKICENFDLCEKCFDKKGHPHQMNITYESESYKRKVQNIKLLLQKEKSQPTRWNIQGKMQQIHLLEQKIYNSSIY